MKANLKNNGVSEKVVVNALNVDVQDATTTKSVKFSGEKETANGMDVSLSKNETVAKLKEFFTPECLIFDPSEIENQMQPFLFFESFT